MMLSRKELFEFSDSGDRQKSDENDAEAEDDYSAMVI